MTSGLAVQASMITEVANVAPAYAMDRVADPSTGLRGDDLITTELDSLGEGGHVELARSGRRAAG